MHAKLQDKKILLAHSNTGSHLASWHERRRQSALLQGYRLSVFSTATLHPYTIFPYLDRKWRRRDAALMKLYDALGEAIDANDIFIHYNGTLIHPEFLEQFDKIKIYHCADDPDASRVVSKPVARYYDMCAISNPACIDMYKRWGCRNVFFWPLGAFHYEDSPSLKEPYDEERTRDIPLVFVGSKLGSASIRFIGKYLGLYKKKRFMSNIERTFPEMVAYGYGWRSGYCSDELVPSLYSRSRIGLNVHNSLGPINGRLYDLAAFGVCQICDNKSNLSLVFEEGKEIIGFDTLNECIDLIRYYDAHRDEARKIGVAGRSRYLQDYTTDKIWLKFFSQVGQVLGNIDRQNSR